MSRCFLRGSVAPHPFVIPPVPIQACGSGFCEVLYGWKKLPSQSKIVKCVQGEDQKREVGGCRYFSSQPRRWRQDWAGWAQNSCSEAWEQEGNIWSLGTSSGSQIGKIIWEKKYTFTLPTVFPYCPAALGRAPDLPHLGGLVELCLCWAMSLQISALGDVIGSLSAQFGQIIVSMHF